MILLEDNKEQCGRVTGVGHPSQYLLSARDIKQSADTGGEADGDNVTKISRISHKGGCPEGKNRIYHTSAGRWEEGLV